mmetsp:Transcript_167061/g.536447  ORF Transcript_167061/g.536447 Transcript_167061/m.536447 type:complete len:236 (+) Transcript_167061:396-1103(+)
MGYSGLPSSKNPASSAPGGTYWGPRPAAQAMEPSCPAPTTAAAEAAAAAAAASMSRPRSPTAALALRLRTPATPSELTSKTELDNSRSGSTISSCGVGATTRSNSTRSVRRPIKGSEPSERRPTLSGTGISSLATALPEDSKRLSWSTSATSLLPFTNRRTPAARPLPLYVTATCCHRPTTTVVEPRTRMPCVDPSSPDMKTKSLLSCNRTSQPRRPPPAVRLVRDARAPSCQAA